MFFDVKNLGVFPDMEGMNTVVLAFQPARIVNPAPRNDRYVGAVFHIKVVIYQIVQPRFRQNDGNIHPFSLSGRTNENIDTGLVFLRLDIDIRRSVSAGELPVIPDIICALRDLFKPRDLFQQAFFHFTEFHSDRLLRFIDKRFARRRGR